MIEGSLKRGLILNGTDSVATFRENGAVYRVADINTIQEITVYSLEKNKNKIVKLGDRLTKDYEILGITVDIPDDDINEQTQTKDPGSQAKVKVGIRIFSHSKAIENVELELTPFPSYTNKLYINHRDTWHIKTDRNVDRITFKCIPVYIEQPIVFP